MTHTRNHMLGKAGCIAVCLLLCITLFAALPAGAFAEAQPTAVPNEQVTATPTPVPTPVPTPIPTPTPGITAVSVATPTPGATATPNASPTPVPTPEPPSGGGVTVLGYVTQTAAGSEIQTLDPNQKCQIVVKLRDERFNETLKPKGYAEGQQFVNIKLTSTATFSTPSMGDISFANVAFVNNGLEYAVVFNDIMYLGGANTFSFDVTYPYESVGLQSVSVGLSQCRDPKNETGAKPNLMVKQSAFGSASINAGDSFILSVNSFNTSTSQGLTDITTSVSLPAALSLADGSNTVLTSSVAAGGTYTANFALQALPSAEQGVANVTINYTYYVKGTSEQLTSSQTITIPIVQPDRFTFMALDAPTEMFVGEEGSLSINFVNKGKGTLYNLTAEIAGNIDNPGQSQYLGNLNSGTEGSADFSILCSKAGAASGTITIIYEDVNGAEKRQTKEFSVQVMDAPTMEDPGMQPDIGMPDMPMEQPGMPWWGWLLIGLGVVVVIIVIIVIVKKAKARKRARELADEDEEDEDF